MIYITGDCHADWRKFSTESFPEQKDMTRDDFEFTILSELVIKLICDNVVFVDGLGLRTEEESSSGQTSTEASTGEATTGEATTKEEETTK